MWYESIYLHNVEDTLQQLRTKCLGLDTSLTAILPCHLRQAPEDRKAAQLANQLVYALAATSLDTSPEELARSREWLYGIILYLLTECCEDDQTLLGIHTMIKATEAERWMLLKKLGEQVSLHSGESLPRVLTTRLDIFLLHLLVSCDRLEQSRMLYEKLKEFQ